MSGFMSLLGVNLRVYGRRLHGFRASGFRFRV